MATLSPESQLGAADLIFRGIAADPELQTALLPFGYDAARLSAGRALYDTAFEATRKQHDLYQVQYGVTQRFAAAWQTAKDRFKKDQRLFKVVLKEHPTLFAGRLSFQKPKDRAYNVRYTWMQEIYRTALNTPELLVALAEYGLTAARLQAGLDLLEIAQALNVEQEAAKHAAQTATQLRDAALTALDGYQAKLKAALLAALEGTATQKLESLGLGPVA